MVAEGGALVKVVVLVVAGSEAAVMALGEMAVALEVDEKAEVAVQREVETAVDEEESQEA